jgi:hypothetical protein
MLDSGGISMHVRTLLVVVVLLLISVPAGFSQGIGKKCDVSGTWYGGSADPLQYLWTITPIGAGRYQSLIQAGFYPPAGQKSWTTWSGEITKIDGKSYESQEMSYWVFEGSPLPQVQIVHTDIELTDCNTLVSTIDLWAAYLSFTLEMTPFVDDPDLDLLLILNGGQPIIETYRRLPTPGK